MSVASCQNTVSFSRSQVMRKLRCPWKNTHTITQVSVEKRERESGGGGGHRERERERDERERERERRERERERDFDTIDREFLFMNFFLPFLPPPSLLPVSSLSPSPFRLPSLPLPPHAIIHTSCLSPPPPPPPNTHTQAET